MTTLKSTPNTGPDTEPGERLHVVAAVIRDEAGRILIAKRPADLHQGGLWEFPGGKVETDERITDALIRELQEELAIVTERYRPLIRIPYNYPDRKVLLDIWLVTGFSGDAYGAEGQEVRWVEADKLHQYTFPAANTPIVMAAQLPDCYLITPEPGEKGEWHSFLDSLHQSLLAGIKLVQFRAKSLSLPDYRALAIEVIALCHKLGVRVLLNATPEMAETLGADGVHLTSKALSCLDTRPLPENQLLAASCHTLEDLKLAEGIGCDFSVISPVKATATHPEAKGIGWEAVQRMTEHSVLPVYALGGMTADDLENAWQHGAQGIAAIRSLWKGQ